MLARSFLICLFLLGAAVVAAQSISPEERALMRETRETMRSLAQDLRAYAATHEDAFPETLNALIDAGLREELPKDAWGRAFVYSVDEELGYKLISRGADGKEGGEGANADIVWTRQGEQVQLTGEQQAEFDRLREEIRHHARMALARARMIIAGREAAQFRKTNGEWPESLAAAMREGESKEDKAVNACFIDPWGNAFEMRVLPAENIAVVCWGADGAQGGRGHNADFVISERDIRAFVRTASQDMGWGSSGFDWQAENLASEVETFRAKHDRLPDELEELTRGGPGEAIRASLPTDIWGNDYIYFKLDDDNFVVIGLGQDQRAGGTQENADVIYPKPGGTPETGRRGMRGGVVVRPADPEAEAKKQNELLVEVAVAQLGNIADQLRAYKDEHGQWPESLEDIAALLPGEEVPNDPWESAFRYELTPDGEGNVTGFKLTCFGSDGEEAGEGHAADIVFTQDGRYEPEPEAPEEAEAAEPRFR